MKKILKLLMLLIIAAMMLLIGGCEKKTSHDPDSDPITWSWKIHSVHNKNENKTTSFWGGKYPTFSSDGSSYTLATGKAEKNIHTGSVEKTGEGEYTFKYAKDEKTGTISIKDNKMAVVMGHITIYYVLDE